MGKLEMTSTPQYSEISSEIFDISSELNLQLLQHELIKDPELSLEQYIQLITESIGDAKEILDSGKELSKDHPLVQIMIPKALSNRIERDDEIYHKRKEHFDLLCYLCGLRKEYSHNKVNLTATQSPKYSQDFAIRFLAQHLYYNNPLVLFKDHEILSHDEKVASGIYHHTGIRDREKVSRKYIPTISVRRDQGKELNHDQHSEFDDNPMHFRDSDSYFDIYADEMAHAIQYKEDSYLLSHKHERDRVSSFGKGSESYNQQYGIGQETLESNAHRIKKYQYIDSVLDTQITIQRLDSLKPQDKPIGVIWRLLAAYINHDFTLPNENQYGKFFTSLDDFQKKQCFQILHTMTNKDLGNKDLGDNHAVYLSPDSYQNLVPAGFKIEEFFDSIKPFLK